jgi:phage FluMu protein Com
MVLFDLVVSCESDHVKELTYSGSDYEYPTSNNVRWHLTIKCTLCSTTNQGEIYFSGNEKVEIPDSRGSCNFLMKCKTCKSLMQFLWLEDTPRTVPLTNKGNQ